VSVLVWVLLVLAALLIEAEVIAWCRPLQRALVRRAAAPLPRQHRERYIEEWYRELEELPDGPVTRLSWVLLLLLRRGSLARALTVSRSVAGSTGALILFAANEQVVFTKPHVRYGLLSKKTYALRTEGMITYVHTGRAGEITHVDLRLGDGKFLRKVPIDYFRV
jgi:hypothetical protein